MATKWAHAGAVDTNSAKIKARFESINPPTQEDKFKVYAIQNKWPADPGELNVWVNGELIDTVQGTNMYLSNLRNLLVGGDGDNHEGYIAEVMGYATGWNSVPASEIVSYSEYLADKWLPTGDTLPTGHTVASSEGAEPSFSTGGAQDGIGKWFHMDETSIVDDGAGKADRWDEKISYSGHTRACSYFDYNGTGLKLPIEAGAGKNGKDLIHFNGDNSFVYDNFETGDDPGYAVVFVVAKFDDYSDNKSKSVLGSVSDAPYGNWNYLGLKKYNSETSLRVTVFLAGYKAIDIPADKVKNQDPATEFIDVRLEYGVDGNFQASSFTPIVTVESPSYVGEFNLSGLTENITHYYRFEIEGSIDNSFTGKFKTFKSGAFSFNFVAGSCQTSNGNNTTYSNSQVFSEILNSGAQLFIHLGDLHYEDISVDNIQNFRDAFDGVMSGSNVKDLWGGMAVAYIWDDHDYGPNNSAANSPSRASALAFYEEQIAHYPLAGDINTFGASQAWTVGRVRFIMPDNRANRDPFGVAYDDPDKTIWGADTKQWFKDQITAAQADDNISLIVWADPASWSGETTNPYDWVYGVSVESWSAFLEERKEISNFLYDNEVKNILHICGDTHMQAIDDGRNMMYVTDADGNYIDSSQLREDLLHICVEASPFDRAVGLGGAKFQINDIPASGGPYPLNEETWTLFKVTDFGEDWIQVRIEQWQLQNGNPTLIRNYTFNKEAVGTAGNPPEITDNPKAYSYKGNFKLPAGVHQKAVRTLEIEKPSNLSPEWKAEVDVKSNYFETPFSNQEIEFYRVSDIAYLIETVDVGDDGIASFQPSRSVGGMRYILKNKTTGEQIGNILNINILFGDVYENLDIELYEVTDANYINDYQDAPFKNSYLFRQSNPISPGFPEAQITSYGDVIATYDVDDIVTKEIMQSVGHDLQVNDRIEFKGRYYIITSTSGDSFTVTPPLPTTSFDVADTFDKVERIIYANSVFDLKLPRSYRIPLGDADAETSFPKRSYTYDCALSIIASVGTENFSIADEIVEDLSVAQYDDGGFSFSVFQNAPQPSANDRYIRNGATGWVAYSLAFFLKYYPNSPNASMVETMLVDVLAFLDSYRDGTEPAQQNLVRGGSGLYTLTGGVESFDESYEIPWFSTEHNIDAYEAFKLAGEVLNNSSYTTISEEIKTSMLDNLWDNANNRFFQGMDGSGNPDTADALDCNSWGAMMLMSAGEWDKVENLLNRCEIYYRSQNAEIGAEGYKPYSADWGYPGAAETVWFEGSFGVAMAYYKYGNMQMYEKIMSDLEKFQTENGAFRYAVLRDETYEISNYESIASTAWYVMSELLSDKVWKSAPKPADVPVDSSVPQNFSVSVESAAQPPSNFSVSLQTV